MTGMEKYLYSRFENIKIDVLTDITVSEAYSRINAALGKDYSETMGTIEKHASDKAFIAYSKGFKDGMSFMLNMVTTN